MPLWEGTLSELTTTPPTPSVDRARGSLRWGAIALGAAVDIAGTRLCITAITLVVEIRAAILQPPTTLDPAATQVAIQYTLSGQGLYALLTVVGLLCSVAGGYLAAYVAKTAILLNAAVAGTCSGLVGLLIADVSSGHSPTWSQVALTATTIPAALLGGLLRRASAGIKRGER